MAASILHTITGCVFEHLIKAHPSSRLSLIPSISENSYLKWKKYTLGKQLFENMILNFNTIQCQTDQDVQRFVKLGAIEENVKMFGNVKLIVTNNHVD